MTLVIDKNAGLTGGYRGGPKRPEENTCPTQASVHGAVRMEIAKTFSYIL